MTGSPGLNSRFIHILIYYIPYVFIQSASCSLLINGSVLQASFVPLRSYSHMQTLSLENDPLYTYKLHALFSYIYIDYILVVVPC